jgi:hypothetical protein
MAKSAAKPKGATKSQLLAQLKQLLTNRQSDLAWHREVGQRVDQIVPDRNYSKAEISGLAEQVGETDVFLYKVRKFAKLYRQKDLPTLAGLTFSHVVALLGVKDAKLRDTIRQACQKHGWTNQKLWLEVQERNGKQSQGGRPLNKALKVGPIVALRMTIRQCEAWQHQCVHALELNLDRLATRLKRKPDDDELRELVAEACLALSRLQAAAGKARRELKAIRAASK